MDFINLTFNLDQPNFKVLQHLESNQFTRKFCQLINLKILKYANLSMFSFQKLAVKVLLLYPLNHCQLNLNPRLLLLENAHQFCERLVNRPKKAIFLLQRAHLIFMIKNQILLYNKDPWLQTFQCLLIRLRVKVLLLRFRDLRFRQIVVIKSFY